MAKRHLTSTEAAALIGVRPQTLAAWRCLGRGPSYVKLSPGRYGRILYNLNDLEEWLTSRTFTSTSAQTVADLEAMR